jgi:hypothetical protein
MKYRIIQKDDKFFVQCRSGRLFGSWQPFTTYSGLSKPFPHGSYDLAMFALLKKVEKGCVNESRYHVVHPVDSIYNGDKNVKRHSLIQNP